MTAALIIIAAIVGYFLFALASPTTTCRRCRGYGHNGRRRRRACHRCAGTGTRFRLGAPLAYRAISCYRRHRANGNLTLPPLKPPRRRH